MSLSASYTHVHCLLRHPSFLLLPTNPCPSVYTPMTYQLPPTTSLLLVPILSGFFFFVLIFWLSPFVIILCSLCKGPTCSFEIMNEIIIYSFVVVRFPLNRFSVFDFFF